jgi:NAD(P)-dependent dehydrogenase (short-subunit alcohol dehydrogenase family)
MKKNILIVGASKGIGLAVAQLLYSNYNLITLSQTLSPQLEQLGTQHIPCNILTHNLSQIQLPSTLHGLIYCPGSINLKPFTRLTPTDFETDFNINVLGAIKILQHCYTALKNAQGSSVVVFSTVATALGMPYHSSVVASKSALEGLALSLAAEWAPNQIRVNVVAPSLTNTNLAAHLLNTPEKQEAAAKRHPLQRIGTVNDIAALTQFLIQDQSTWVTGQIMRADGGMSRLKM